MKYIRKPIVIEAFKCGEHYPPPWFITSMTSGLIELVEDNKDIFAIQKVFNGKIYPIKKGYYVIKGNYPFITWDPIHFESTYLIEQETELDITFSSTIEAYNSLHEDLRDLRREISASTYSDYISELLTQIANTALKAKKDLFK